VHALENNIETEHVRSIVARRRLTPAVNPAHVEGWPWRYRLRALGSFQIAIDDDCATGAPLGRGGELRGMPLRLLHAVLAFGGRGVRDTQLIDALWPDAEGDAGRRVFDTTLHRLRRQLGDDDIVRLSDGRVSLDERRCWFDFWALEATLAEVERQVGCGAPATVLCELTRKLLAIYRGPLLAEDYGDGVWVHGPRQRISAKFRRAVDHLSPALESAGRFAEANGLRDRSLQGSEAHDRPRSQVVRALVS
jgi:two-component SAPR family response regulator